MKNKNIEWRKVADNRFGITKMALKDIGYLYPSVGELVGYNGILLGDKVIYKEEVFTVVVVSKVSRSFGLSKNGELPSTVTALPKDVQKYRKQKK